MELGPSVVEGGNVFILGSNGMAQITRGRKILFQGEYYVEISYHLAVILTVSHMKNCFIDHLFSSCCLFFFVLEA